MDLLARLRNKKTQTEAENLPEIPKTPLRLYLENLLAHAKSVGGVGKAKIPGIPVEIDLMKILPVIVRQLSDEMIEGLADFLLIVANDILKIRGRNTFALSGNEEKKSDIEILESETLEVQENETITDSAELPKI